MYLKKYFLILLYMENKNSFFENNYFVYFTRPKRITTYLDKRNKETKKLPFEKDFSWKNINKDI